MSLLALAAMLVQAPAPPAPPQAILPPRDVCAQDASFVRFRADLLDILVRRDRERLLAVIAPDIHFSFGGEAGRTAFIRAWDLDRPLHSGLWHELAGVLMLGCAVENGAMVAPYAFSNWPEVDGVGASFLVYPGARLHRAADATSPVIAELAWQMVQDATPEGAPRDRAWRRVRLPDGRVGFVRAEQLRVDIDYRARFERRAGQWRLTSFVAGD